MFLLVKAAELPPDVVRLGFLFWATDSPPPGEQGIDAATKTLAVHVGNTHGAGGAIVASEEW